MTSNQNSKSKLADVPEHFKITNGYEKVKIGSIHNSNVVVNIPNYDYYIIAGVDENELFSKMLIPTMNIQRYCAIDKIQRLPINFPDKTKILAKQVGYSEREKHETLSYFTKKYNHIFMKMNIDQLFKR